jgi:hypothetical protein
VEAARLYKKQQADEANKAQKEAAEVKKKNCEGKA